MKHSKSATKRMERGAQGVFNACKAILNNSANNGCVINTIDKKLIMNKFSFVQVLTYCNKSDSIIYKMALSLPKFLTEI